MRFSSPYLFIRIAALVLFVAGYAAASDDESSSEPAQSPQSAAQGKLKVSGLTIGGYGFWQFGEIEKGEYFGGSTNSVPMDHQWVNNALIGLSLEANPHPRLHLVLSPEFKLYYPYPERQNAPGTVRPQSVAYLNDGKGVFSFGNVEKPFLQLTLGMFTYKYNTEATNLGEYLFRTGTYPTFVVTDFDFPKARLLGACLTTDAVKNLHADLLVLSEYQYFPLYDFSLAAIADYKLFDAIDIGAGIDLARLIPVNSDKTSPKYSQFSLPAGYNEYIKENGDTGYYSFKATKVMARLSFDPKPLFHMPSIFGPEDLKLYGEVAAVGIEGYTAKSDSASRANGYIDYYNNLDQRTPRMFGFNFPAFKFLNILSIEAEYFPSTIPNDYLQTVQFFSPVPHIDIASYNPDEHKDGFWRWSVYAKKDIIKGFSLVGQVAFDHMRTAWTDGSTDMASCMTQHGNWYWIAKAGYSF
jgi:hypothetical protein